MWDSVRDYWVTFNQPPEGVLSFMYLDAEGLATTGMGNSIDAGRSNLAEPTLDQNASRVDSEGLDPSTLLIAG
jgi:hypothetical protein